MNYTMSGKTIRQQIGDIIESGGGAFASDYDIDLIIEQTCKCDDSGNYSFCVDAETFWEIVDRAELSGL
jgi:hypothetical protein